MKLTSKYCSSLGLLCLFSFLYVQAAAFVVAPIAVSTTQPSMDNRQTVQEFLAISPQSYRAQTGKKMKWGQRLILKLAQKSLKKKLKRGKIKADDPARSESKALSAWSMALGIISLISLIFLLIFPYQVGFLILVSLFTVLGAFITGAIGYAKEDARKMAMTGIITAGITVLISVITLLILLFGVIL